MLNVVDVMFDFMELREGFGWDDVSQVFFKLHGDFDGIEWVQSVVTEGAFFGDTLIYLQLLPFL